MLLVVKGKGRNSWNSIEKIRKFISRLLPLTFPVCDLPDSWRLDASYATEARLQSSLSSIEH